MPKAVEQSGGSDRVPNPNESPLLPLVVEKQHQESAEQIDAWQGVTCKNCASWQSSTGHTMPERNVTRGCIPKLPGYWLAVEPMQQRELRPRILLPVLIVVDCMGRWLVQQGRRPADLLRLCIVLGAVGVVV